MKKHSGTNLNSEKNKTKLKIEPLDGASLNIINVFKEMEEEEEYVDIRGCEEKQVI